MTFTGGSWYMYDHYLDAFAICRKLGNPQFFITFTSNVNWPEIKRFIAQYPELTPSDRADVVCQVFEQRIHAFIVFLKEQRLFRNVTGVLYTVEFQKQGLPHCHTLLWVDSASKIQAAEDVDRFISTEIPDPRIDQDGYNAVSEFMMHGPCGSANSKAVCMKRDQCSKKFPKKFNSKTFFDDKGHVHYQRRDTSISTTRQQFKLDNAYVVPYNQDLLLAFQAHNNVEYCGWSMLIKQMVDKTENYVEGCFVCAHEAYWRILKFDIHRREPTAQVLSVHLQHMQRVTFRDRDRAACEALGLLGDDKEWEIALEEACGSASSEQLRYVFCHILLHYEQKTIYDLIINANLNNRQELIFVYGHGETGKTFLWKAIISTLRSQEKIVLAVASSGIASLLLPSGRTAHSRFKFSLELTEESLCRVTKNSQLGKLLADTDLIIWGLLADTDLIIWDEALMNDRRCFEALDRTLRDILGQSSFLFGCKSILLCGHFRQTLPVKKGASKMEIIASCISESQLWSSFKIFTLKENTRLARPGLSNLIDFIYDKNTLSTLSAATLQRKAIFCLKNETADLINSKVFEIVTSESTSYISQDEATPTENNRAET
uniref:ATP-dependent DNA helicase n=1 Tax=Tanacetum cinerariifolium TaxID=118510 RepID=A0A6L2NX45_TANCI|nr:DNA helicase [Tanacetum cinerariifolium]